MKKIIVIKIGSSIIMTKRRVPDEFRIAHLCDQIASLQQDGFGVVLVISGAVGCGYKFVDQLEVNKQAAAGIGQAIVTAAFAEIFKKKHMQIAQMLITKGQFVTDLQKQTIKQLVLLYLRLGIVPILNENDVLDLHSFGGNDYLAAEIVTLLKSKQLIMLSTMEGSIYGVGGGQSKQAVKQLLTQENIQTIILDGKKKNILLTL